MGNFIHILFCLCSLYFLLNPCDSSRNPWNTSENGTSSIRKSRSITRPIPINCKLAGWSPWTSCNECTENKFRFRYMTKPSQFGGSNCIGTLWDKLACPSSGAQCLEPDYCEESFTCAETGRCISQTLLCNGEPDCEDNSDEDDCDVFHRREDKCSTLLPIPGANAGTQGFNVLTGEFMDRVLDPTYYGGLCEYVYNGEWRKFGYDSFCEKLHYNEDDQNYRKPYNFHAYRFTAEARSEGSNEYYEDVLSLINAKKTEDSFNMGVTIGIQYVEVGVQGSEKSLFLNNITKHQSRDLGFIRLSSKVQTARFKMRSDKLMLHEDMYLTLMELPVQYDFGMYSRFFNIFGTHYVTEGTMGGSLEYVMVINKTTMERYHMNVEQVEQCIGGSIGLGSPLGNQASVDLTLKDRYCETQASFDTDKNRDSSVIEDVITQVKGGASVTHGALLAIRDPDTYRKWGASLKYSPALIEYEIMPIYELVRLSTAAGYVGERLAHMQRAWYEYQLQFSSCRCAPCKNNGVPALQGTACQCICKKGYRGHSCEESDRPAIKTDASWSCWSPWSPCETGRRTRTRACNNPPPESSRDSCLGSASQTQQC